MQSAPICRCFSAPPTIPTVQSASDLASKERLRIMMMMTAATMPLNNDGDTVLLIDPTGVLRSRVEYNAEQFRTGEWVAFGR